MNLCRVCNSTDLYYLGHDVDGFKWNRCATCGSDSSDSSYDRAKYKKEYVDTLVKDEGIVDCYKNHVHNMRLFQKFLPIDIPTEMLDVGTGSGASQQAARMEGWQTEGWDVNSDGRPLGTVVSPVFRASLFPKQFGMVLAREILEHVDHPFVLLEELSFATIPGGLLQITTPRPLDVMEKQAYHWAHLCVWSPRALADQMHKLKMVIRSHTLWRLGQRLIVQKKRW